MTHLAPSANGGWVPLPGGPPPVPSRTAESIPTVGPADPSALDIVASFTTRKGQINLTARRAGKIIDAQTFTVDNLQKRFAFATKHGVPLEQVDAAIAARASVAAAAATAGPPAAATVLLRGLHQASAAGVAIAGATPLAALQQALTVLDFAEPEPVIEWDDATRIAVLDADYHDRPLAERPAREELERLAAQCRPRPALAWATHGRGLRLAFVASADLDANELAACALADLRCRAPGATFEILTHTRHPGYARPGYPAAGTVQTYSLTGAGVAPAPWLSGTVEPDSIAAWLSDHGLQRGGRYAHDRCPVDGGTASHGEPVQVNDDGVYCHRCAAQGRTLGNHRPGWFPWAALLGGGVPPRLANVVEHWCHWEHAQHVVAEDLGLDGAPARLVYRAMLKARHGAADPRLGDVFRRGHGLVRVGGAWATPDFQVHRPDGLRARLECLPALHYRAASGDRPGEPVLDHERLGIFSGIDDLAPFGYPRLVPVRGMKVYHQWRANDNPATVLRVVLPEFLRAESCRAHRPRYEPPAQRLPLAEAEAVISASFPHVNLDYLRLLVAARGCAEGGRGLPPRLLVDGPSGAGKGATVTLAAALLGDRHAKVSWVPDAERFTLALYEQGLQAGLLTCDEVVKLITQAGGGPLARLTSLLSFEPGATVRRLYVGNVRVDRVPVLVLTDTAFPVELHHDEQFGRRFVYVHLERKVSWQRGQDDIEHWRLGRPEHARAANAFVADVIDRYFASAAPRLFEDIAAELGFPLLNQTSYLGQDRTADLLRLFEACCQSRAVPPASSKWKGPGWKKIHQGDSDALASAWQAVCDGDDFTASRRVSEVDWAQLLQVDGPVSCDVSPNGKTTLAIRFRQGNLRSAALRVNEQLAVPAPGAAISEVVPAEAPQSVPGTTSEPDPAPATAPLAAVPAGNEVYIDLETRSACDLAAAGGRRYARHSTTELISVVAALDGRLLVWTPTLATPLDGATLLEPTDPAAARGVDTFAGPDLPAPLARAIAAGRPFCAHNAEGFDRLVWAARGLPEPAAWIDTLPLARAAGLPGRLNELGQRLVGVGKDEDGARLLRRLCKPNAAGLFPPLTVGDLRVLARYNVRDVLLLEKVHDVVRGCAEPAVLALDRTINARGICFDEELARRLLALEAELLTEPFAELAAATGGAVGPADLGRVAWLLAWLRGRGLELPDLRKPTVARALERTDLDPAVRAVLRARQGEQRITGAKLEQALAAVDADGRLRDLLVYHKAHTGRWAGRRVQPHNLPRPHRDLKDVTALIAATGDAAQFRAVLPPTVAAADGLAALVRPCFRAAPGKLLCIADFAGIEARGVAWCAGEQRQLDLFAAGGDNYCDFATLIFGRPVGKQDKRERTVGKEAVLGCGYGMGHERFAARCDEMGIDLAAAGTSAEAVIEAYRATYPAIAGARVAGRQGRRGGLWQDVEDAVRDVVRTGREREAGRCIFRREGDALTVGLPGGRGLRYPNARLERDPTAPAWHRPAIVFDGAKCRGERTYGGKLVENLVQALCRDLLVHAMLACEEAGLPVVLHVHDEIVIEVPEAEADEALVRLLTLMAAPPAWAVGFPLEVEGHVTDRYLKSAAPGRARGAARNGQLLPG